MDTDTLLVLLTISIPWLGGICVWLVGDRHPNIQHRLATVFALLGGIVSLSLLQYTQGQTVINIPLGGAFGDFTLVLDGLGAYLTIIAAVIGGLAVIFSNDYMKGENQLGRYYSLTFLFIGAMIGLVLSGSLLFVFLFWEITAFCSYALISFHNDDPKAVAGGIKALIITSIGGVGLLIGAIVVYAYLNSYQINDLLVGAESLPPSVLGLIAFGFLIAAAAKSAQVPFQTWLPDAMEAPTPISALIHAATMVNAGVYLLARFYPAFETVPGWRMTVMLVGMLSALLAGIMAVVVYDLKRTLAYSTIAQLGVMVYAIGAGAILASQFHLLSHSVFKALLFLGAGAVIHAVGTRDMREMGGLGKQMPFVRVVFIIGAIALIGLPLTNGFVSKELILEAGLEHTPFLLFALVMFGAGLTALYSTRMVWMVFYGEPRGEKHAHDAPGAMRFSLALLAFGTMTTWLLIGPFSQFLANSLPPSYEIEVVKTWEVILKVISTPATWVALLVAFLGASLWFLRDRFAGFVASLQPLADFIRGGLGFEWINQQIIRITKGTAAAFRPTQTGLLSWNVFGIVGGLVILLVLIVWGV